MSLAPPPAGQGGFRIQRPCLQPIGSQLAIRRALPLATRRTQTGPRPWTRFQAGAVLPTLANLGAPKFPASVAAMASRITRTRSQSQTKQ
jgi:hypothetical protein